jgi:PIN domain nuclease of toxin-antitoxin system
MHAQPERLGAHARQAIEDVQNQRFLSAASAWEIAIKYALGRLPLPQPPAQYLPSRLPLGVTQSLPVTQEHALRVADLPRHHRDPFDRPLVAQCQAERLHLLTADRRFQPYEIDIIWAE